METIVVAKDLHFISSLEYKSHSHTWRPLLLSRTYSHIISSLEYIVTPNIICLYIHLIQQMEKNYIFLFLHGTHGSKVCMEFDITMNLVFVNGQSTETQLKGNLLIWILLKKIKSTQIMSTEKLPQLELSNHTLYTHSFQVYFIEKFRLIFIPFYLALNLSKGFFFPKWWFITIYMN